MDGSRHVDRDVGAIRPELHPGRAAAALAARQAGVVHRRQLRELGVDDDRIKRWVAAGRLHRIHRAVYAVGHPLLSVDGRCHAAILACGPASRIGGATAAALWELAAHPAQGIEVVTTATGLRAPAVVRLRRTTRLGPEECGEVRGIPVTSVARTLADLAAQVSRRRLERAMEQADRLQLLDAERLLASARDRPGARAVRAVLAEWSPAPTKSELEDRLLALVERSELPRPAVNVLLGPHECDQVWAVARLVVEADSRRFHGTHAAMERDRRKDAYLTRGGWRVLRFTWQQVTREPEAVVATIRTALRDAGRLPGG